MKIAFIGGGNMATALIAGMFKSNPDSIIQVGDPGTEVKQRLESQWPLTCYPSAAQAIAAMDVIVLAVKPQILPVVLAEIGDLVTAKQLLVSVMAGVTTEDIASGVKASAPVIRTMPNTPALLGLGITALFADSNCSQLHCDQAQQLMATAGETVWLEHEDLINVVTAVSGSGPAYFFYLIEAMSNAGARLGLPEEVANKLAVHTAYGASAMAVESDVGVEILRQRVTSKGGTTQAALESMRKHEFEQLIDAAVSAATERGRQLAGGTSPSAAGTS